MRAYDYRELARDSLRGNWLLSVLVLFLASLLGAAGGISLNLDEEDLKVLITIPGVLQFLQLYLAYAFVISFVSFIIGGTVRLGLNQYLLDQYDGRPLEVKTLFSHFHQFGNGFCLQLLTNIFVALWTLLFIIPGFVASYRYAMAPYIQAEHPEYSAMDSIRASKELMQGNKWSLFCLDMSFFGWALLSVLTLGIGQLFLSPYINAAHAAFYRQLCPSQPLIESR